MTGSDSCRAGQNELGDSHGQVSTVLGQVTSPVFFLLLGRPPNSEDVGTLAKALASGMV